MISTITSLWLTAALAGLALHGRALNAAEAATALPALNHQPGPEYADKARMFQGIPAIERAPNGWLWAAWLGGGVTEDRHNYILLSTSGDAGQTQNSALSIIPVWTLAVR